jgi:integrase
LEEKQTRVYATAEGRAETARETTRTSEEGKEAMKTKTRGIFEKIVGSKIWWIRYTDGSGRYRRERVGPYSLAEKLLAKRRAEAIQGKKLPETLRRRSISFSEIAADALAYSKVFKRSWTDDESRMKVLLEWFGNRDAESITTSEMEQKLSDATRSNGWAASTHNHYRSLLMLVYREARRADKVQVNPARDVRHRREDNSRVRYLNQFEPFPTDIEYLKPYTTEEGRLRAVVEHEYPQHMPELDLALSTGLRMSSMYGLTWSMVDWDRRMLNIPTSKNGEALHIPLNNAAMAALRTVFQRGEKTGRIFRSDKTGRPLENWRHWIGKAAKKAGIENFRGHDFRHCFASQLRMRGAKLEDIGELLAHKSLAMTKRYAHLGPNQLHQVSALLDTISTTVAPTLKTEGETSTSLLN